jgi:hypothetical protein
VKKYPPTDAEGVAKVAAVREVELKLSRRRIRSLFSADAPVHVIDIRAPTISSSSVMRRLF